MPLNLVTAPAGEYISKADLYDHLRLDASGSPESHADDDLLDALILAVRQHLEGKDGYLGRCIVPQTWDWTQDSFPSGKGSFRVPLPPLISVVSIKYIDTDGDEQTLAGSVYSVDTASQPGLIHLVYNQSWPSIRKQHNAVTVRITAGYATTSSPVTNYGENVPGPIIAASKLLIGHLYNNREATIAGITITTVPMAVDSLLGPFQMYGRH